MMGERPLPVLCEVRDCGRSACFVLHRRLRHENGSVVTKPIAYCAEHYGAANNFHARAHACR